MSSPSMPYLAPDEILCLRKTAIDRQHHEIANLVNGLQESIKTGEPGGAVAARLTGHYNLATIHYATEEQIRRLHKYPKLPTHKAAQAAWLRFDSKPLSGNGSCPWNMSSR